MALLLLSLGNNTIKIVENKEWSKMAIWNQIVLGFYLFFTWINYLVRDFERLRNTYDFINNINDG